MFLINKNFIFEIRRSKVTDYAALKTWLLRGVAGFPYISLYKTLNIFETNGQIKKNNLARIITM